MCTRIYTPNRIGTSAEGPNGSGGGVHVNGGTLIMRGDSRVENNRSQSAGGGVGGSRFSQIRHGVYMFDNASVSNNVAGTQGGGVSLITSPTEGGGAGGTGELVMMGGRISGNAQVVVTTAAVLGLFPINRVMFCGLRAARSQITTQALAAALVPVPCMA